MSEGVEFKVDGETVNAGEVRAVATFDLDGFGHVEAILTGEGVIIDGYNEEGEHYKTQAFTYEEWATAEETQRCCPSCGDDLRDPPTPLCAMPQAHGRPA